MLKEYMEKAFFLDRDGIINVDHDISAKRKISNLIRGFSKLVE
jgi:histidinol phosphatase-like enzyme